MSVDWFDSMLDRMIYVTSNKHSALFWFCVGGRAWHREGLISFGKELEEAGNNLIDKL